MKERHHGDPVLVYGQRRENQVVVARDESSFELIELWDEYHDRGLALVGVSVNDLPRDSREFAADMEMPYPLAIGTPKMLEEYGLSPWLPTTLLVVDGQIVEEWVGPKIRSDLEYPIRVALGLAPPIADVLHSVSDNETP